MLNCTGTNRREAFAFLPTTRPKSGFKPRVDRGERPVVLGVLGLLLVFNNQIAAAAERCHGVASGPGRKRWRSQRGA
jgi:hypothetical protein